MRVGVLGGGQLGRMLALAGAPLGISTIHLDPAQDACAGQVAPVLVGRYDDPALVAELSRQVDVVTVELEQVPLGAFDHVREGVPARPPAAAVEVTQDRLLEKRLFRELGIPAPRFHAVDGPDDVKAAVEALGLPLLLKTRDGGYDGKGQLLVRDPAALAGAWDELGGRLLIAEEVVSFEREVSVVAVRGLDGETRAYPLVENLHAGGILRVTRAPAETDATLAADAERYAARILDRLGHVGVLAVELFDAGGQLLANEIAPRVHNSGHWTIEGAETSQFENHLRAICGLPLGSTALVRPSAMVNLIGDVPPAADVLAIPGARLHLYGKAPRPGRKLGHVTVTAPDEGTLLRRLASVRALVRIADGAA
ncbi:MAG: 5-(carboxyamino)imidazole ribonucleotide synthase [Thermoleophilia bacterium]